MKLHLTLHVDLPAWDDPDLSLTEKLRVMAEEYPSVASLLAEALDSDTLLIRVELEPGGSGPPSTSCCSVGPQTDRSRGYWTA